MEAKVKAESKAKAEQAKKDAWERRVNEKRQEKLQGMLLEWLTPPPPVVQFADPTPWWNTLNRWMRFCRCQHEASNDG